MAVSLECNQILRIGLGVVEDNKHAGIGDLVHNTVEQLNGERTLGWWSNHVLLTKGVVSSQHSAEVHDLLPVGVGLGIGVLGRVTGVYSKVSAVPIACSWERDKQEV